MKLQLALDLVDIQGARSLLEKVADLIDIAEIGTPFVINEGVNAVTEIKKAYPELEVLADLKIMDEGALESKIAFEAGADIVTVLGVTNDVTIQGAVNQARAYDKKVMVDMMAVIDFPERARQIDAMGADYVCVHTSTDVQKLGLNPLHELELVHPLLEHAGLAVAGGVKPEILSQIVTFRPEIVVVGSFITGHPDPREAALAIREGLN